MTVKEHYDNHLAEFYSWILGDFDTAKNRFKDYCIENKIKPIDSGLAIDLGAGNGIQSIALAEIGFKVRAIDFNDRLLSELEAKIDNYSIKIVNDDIINLRTILNGQSGDLIVCCGDTISHLETFDDLKKLLQDCYDSLVGKGQLILTFRDYSNQLKDTQRFIPVKSDDNRILTCIIDYFDNKVNVTDLLHEKVEGMWKQKVSSYEKLRITTNLLIDISQTIGFSVKDNNNINRMIHLILQK